MHIVSTKNVVTVDMEKAVIFHRNECALVIDGTSEPDAPNVIIKNAHFCGVHGKMRFIMRLRACWHLWKFLRKEE